MVEPVIGPCSRCDGTGVAALPKRSKASPVLEYVLCSCPAARHRGVSDRLSRVQRAPW